MSEPESEIREADLDTCVRVLEQLAADRRPLASIDPDRRRALLIAAGRLVHPERTERRKLAKAFRKKDRDTRRTTDEERLDRTELRALRREAVFSTPSPVLELPPSAAETIELLEPRDCYVCKAPYRRVHFFYDALCPKCGDFNFEKRNQTADLSGRVALITGARVKIGYHAAIKLLRAGARVIVTTRFPRDAAERYAREPDFDEWSSRLEIFGLDLRHTPSVEQLAQHLLSRLDRLDFIIHNACQTVRRPPGFYHHLLEREQQPPSALPEGTRTLLSAYENYRAPALVTSGAGAAVGLLAPAELSQLALLPGDREHHGIFPSGMLDADLQQVDLREMNSWRLKLAEVPTVELLEVQLVNAVAPFVLSGRLKPLLLRHRTFDKHVVNVSAMEGQFQRTFKTDRHPHTNMAKAALNMLTRTSAQDYARDGIYMNSVDTGWITDEDPVALAEKKATEQGAVFRPPLDVVDGAARIVAPIFDGFRSGEHVWGLFLKDYQPAPW